MAKLNKQQLKDGQAYERALSKVGYAPIYTLKVIHYWNKQGDVLCGFKGQLYKDTNLPVHKMPVCGKCLARLNKLIEAELKEETRNYWMTECSAGVLHPAMPKPVKAQAQPTWAQDGLSDELLPTGTGKGKGLF